MERLTKVGKITPKRSVDLKTDLMDGTVYKLSDNMRTDDGVLKNIPVSDRPFMLTFGEFCDWEEVK